MKTNKYKVKVNGIAYEVEIEPFIEANQIPLSTRVSGSHKSFQQAQTQQVQIQQAQGNIETKQEVKALGQASEAVLAPMQGKIVSVAVSKGQAVKKGQVLAVLEAMKMENEIMAANDGQIQDVHVSAGQSVEANDILVSFA
jgi:biotin carboxyl carrier protein